MRHRLRTFLSSRYGLDGLSYALLVCTALLLVLAHVSHWPVFSLLGCIALVWALARSLSGNLNGRWAENQRFLRPFRALGGAVRDRRTLRRQSRTHKFFTCPGCSQRLRVPRGKGELHITCPRCGQRFRGKT